jgi:hypothetical protein
MEEILLKVKWSAIQIEIWENVKTYTKLILDGHIKEFLKYFHKDYSAWNCYEPLPVGKNDIINELKDFYQPEVISYDTIPISINIFNDIAIVHYFYSVTFKNADGMEKSKYSHNTDVLIRQKKKWLIIGDNGGLTRVS